MGNVTRMPRGDSGRIVIEVDPMMKRRLYAALSISGSTLKDWFVQSAQEYCGEIEQPGLFSRETLRAKPPHERRLSQG